MGLVIALGFLLLVSLAASAAISALSGWINQLLPFGSVIVEGLNILFSFFLIALLFAAIYKVLPDRELQWRDVWFGAFVTSALFTIGKSLIGLYIGSSGVASSFGAASALIVVLLWIYYASLIFLLGAEFTHAYSLEHGSQRGGGQSSHNSSPRRGQ
ncbi:YhjD/YihY/BrkB family envelope integrity protein [Mesorhizobium sp. B2-5-13]|uniref:YihY/virulence factor BrkB family protein n=1 Tax=unclassified Mesorhizobium TaxID=325217 RepID=UPI0032B18188